MDLPANNSSPVQPPNVVQVDTKRSHGFLSLLRRVGVVAVIGLLFGGVVSGLAIFLPYNRVVVYDQPVGPDIKIRSARLVDGGFVVVYLNTLGGWQVVGYTSYLPPGYYRNIVVPIDSGVFLTPQAEIKGLIARMYKDTGDHVFQESSDIPIKDVFGRVHTKHFWFTYIGAERKQFLSSFLDRPLILSIDLLFP